MTSSLCKLVCGHISPFLKLCSHYPHFIAPRHAVSFHYSLPHDSTEHRGCMKITNIWLEPVHHQFLVNGLTHTDMLVFWIIINLPFSCQSLLSPIQSSIKTWSELTCQAMTVMKPCCVRMKITQRAVFHHDYSYTWQAPVDYYKSVRNPNNIGVLHNRNFVVWYMPFHVTQTAFNMKNSGFSVSFLTFLVGVEASK